MTLSNNYHQGDYEIMHNLQTNTKKNICIVLSIIGIILSLIINNKYLGVLIAPTMQLNMLMKFIIFDCYLIFVPLLFLIDYTKNRLISICGLLFLIVSLIYKYLIVLPSALKAPTEVENIESTYFIANSTIELIAEVLILIILIQFVFVKKRANRFIKNSIFFLPFLYLISSFKWFNNSTNQDFLNSLLAHIKGYSGKAFIIWLIMTIVLYLKSTND